MEPTACPTTAPTTAACPTTAATSWPSTWRRRRSLRRSGSTCFVSGDGGSAEYDPVQHADWNLVKFAPLICPRVHSDGVIRQLSEQFLGEHGRFLLLIAFRPSGAADMRAADKLVIAQLVPCQRRTQEARRVFAGIADVVTLRKIQHSDSCCAECRGCESRRSRRCWWCDGAARAS